MRLLRDDDARASRTNCKRDISRTRWDAFDRKIVRAMCLSLIRSCSFLRSEIRNPHKKNQAGLDLAYSRFECIPFNIRKKKRQDFLLVSRVISVINFRGRSAFERIALYR